MDRNARYQQVRAERRRGLEPTYFRQLKSILEKRWKLILAFALTILIIIFFYYPSPTILPGDIPITLFNDTANAKLRIVAVGDLHGDYRNALRAFKVAGVLNDNAEWIGGSTTLVQTGDIVDRGPDTIKIYRMMMRIRKEAEAQGGQVIQLLGNHELMNMAEDYRYVTKEDVQSFGGMADRLAAWRLDGWLGKYLRTLDCVANVNGNIFLHGGLHSKYARIGIEQINEKLHVLLSSAAPQDINQSPLLHEDGPLWYRGYALSEEPTICQELNKALTILKAKRMIMGHTVQEGGKITTRCAGKIVLIDIGISSPYGGNVGALEIYGDVLTAHYPKKREILLK